MVNVPFWWWISNVPSAVTGANLLSSVDSPHSHTAIPRAGCPSGPSTAPRIRGRLGEGVGVGVGAGVCVAVGVGVGEGVGVGLGVGVAAVAAVGLASGTGTPAAVSEDMAGGSWRG